MLTNENNCNWTFGYVGCQFVERYFMTMWSIILRPYHAFVELFTFYDMSFLWSSKNTYRFCFYVLIWKIWILYKLSTCFTLSRALAIRMFYLHAIYFLFALHVCVNLCVLLWEKTLVLCACATLWPIAIFMIS
jgi:hypothetical protein